MTAILCGVGQEAASWHAVRKTQAPMGLMAPHSSATGMKSAGDTGPCPGRFQRSNTSKPVISSVATDFCTW
ncbi:hypothetical protein D3C85_1830360 [compost metagenome]